MDLKDDIARFLARTDPFRRIYRALDARTILAKRRGQWYNVLTSLRLSPDLAPTENNLLEIETSDFLAGHYVVAARQVDDVLGELPEGKITLGRRKVAMATPTSRAPAGTDAVDDYRYTWQVQTFAREHVRGNLGSVPPFKSFVLRGTGQGLSNIWTEAEFEGLETVLLRGEPHYVGISDLARSLIGLPYQIYIGSTCTFDLLAPVYSRFEQELTLSGSELAVSCSGPETAAPKDYKLAGIVRGRGNETRPSATLSDVAKPDDSRRLLLQGKLSVSGGDEAELHLLFFGEQVDKLVVSLPSASSSNARLLAMNHFDPGLARLSRLLTALPDDTASADVFNEALAWLLYLAGFQVASFDSKKSGLIRLANAVDLVAFVPYTRTVLAIEATWRDPLNREKMTKLRRRADELSGDLPGYEVVPVEITASPTGYGTETAEAENLKISILRPMHLNEILTMAQRNTPASDILEYIRQRR